MELFGIAVALFGLAAGYFYPGPGVANPPSPHIAGLGAVIALIGLALHIARV